MLNLSNNIACVILAGGNNRRIGGRNKGLIQIGNSTIIENITSEVDKIFSELILVTNTPEIYDSFKTKYSIISDVIKNVGPLGGIYSALTFTKCEAVFIAPCDMPFINHNIIKIILEKYHETDCDAIVPRIDNFIEPLLAIYKKDIKDKLFSYINSENDYSIRQFLKKINVHFFDFENNDDIKKILTNINSASDLENVKRKFLSNNHEDI